jgi:hypothetical protein
MCCLFTTLVLLGPRVGILVWWLIQPLRWQIAFSSWFWPLLGFIFLPWTTIMFVAVGVNGLAWFDWIWMGLALMADLGSYGGGAYGNRDRVPGYAR